MDIITASSDGRICKQFVCPPKDFSAYVSSITSMKKELEKAYYTRYISDDEIEFIACTFEQIGNMLRNMKKEGEKIGKAERKQEQA